MNYQKINTILMRLVAVLLMLVMLSTAAVTGRFARYISSASGSDSARVAKFDVVHTVAPVEGENGKFIVTVKNNSEVAVEYNVGIKFLEDLNDCDLKATLDGEVGTFYDSTDTFTFDEKYRLAPSGEQNHTLIITLENRKAVTDGAENTDTPEDAEKTFKFKASVTAVQID